MTLREKQAEFMGLWAQVVIYARDVLKTPIVMLEWLRTKERQAYLVSIGRSKTLASLHLDGLAIDFCFLQDLRDDGRLNWTAAKYQDLILYAESIGLVSGARFGDDPTTPLVDGWDLGHLQYKGAA